MISGRKKEEKRQRRGAVGAEISQRRKTKSTGRNECATAGRPEGRRYKGLENLRLAVIPLDSVMVMVWLTGTAESLSIWPLGQ